MITKYNSFLIGENAKFDRILLDNKDDIKNYLSIYFKMSDKHYHINDDLTVDVNTYQARISYKDSKYKCLPINFGEFSGELDLSNNDFITLDGSPKILDGSFYCNSNKLKTLKGSPEIVKGHYSCDYNNIENLEGSPNTVKSFSCTSTKIKTLKGFPKTIISSNFECLRNQYTLTDIKDLPFNIFEYIISKNDDSWLDYLDGYVFKDYLEYYLDNGLDMRYFNILKRYLKLYNLENKYIHLYNAENFDLL